MHTAGNRENGEAMLSVCIKTGRECMPWVSPLFAKTSANPDPGHTLLMGLKGFT